MPLSSWVVSMAAGLVVMSALVALAFVTGSTASIAIVADAAGWLARYAMFLFLLLAIGRRRRRERDEEVPLPDERTEQRTVDHDRPRVPSAVGE